MIIVIDSERKIRFLFLRGIFICFIIFVGIDVGIVYVIVIEVQKEFEWKGKKLVIIEEIRELMYQKFLEKGFREEVKRYLFWCELRRRKVRLIVFLGGVIGVGKFMIVIELVFRFGIWSIIGIDMIREVMRKIIVKEFFFDIYVFLFFVERVVKVFKNFDLFIYGFEIQVKYVLVGIKVVFERVRREGLNILIEGIYVVLGFVELREDEFMYVIVVFKKDYFIVYFYECV